MKWPPQRAGARPNAPDSPKLRRAQSNSGVAISQERFWHERAVEHQQRLLIIRLLASVDRKLELLLQRSALL